MQKILAIVNHYFGAGKTFNGKSAYQDPAIRKGIVEQVIRGLREIPGVEVCVCGVKGKSLIPIDQDFSHLTNPLFLVYETIEWMTSLVDQYDYFINIEDDVLLPLKTFERIVRFDKVSPIGECFHPNRMEYKDGEEYCVDLVATPGWKDIEKQFEGLILRVAVNPHSGLAVLSREKLLYAKTQVDFAKRGIIIGYYMASAYANLHTPFLMFRAAEKISAHMVIHLDRCDNWKSGLILADG